MNMCEAGKSPEQSDICARCRDVTIASIEREQFDLYRQPESLARSARLVVLDERLKALHSESRCSVPVSAGVQPSWSGVSVFRPGPEVLIPPSISSSTAWSHIRQSPELVSQLAEYYRLERMHA